MEIVFSKKFQKEFMKIKDRSLLLRIASQINKLGKMPYSGKPLKYNFKNYRSLRVTPFRIIYRIDNDKIIVNCLGHRKKIY